MGKALAQTGSRRHPPGVGHQPTAKRPHRHQFVLPPGDLRLAVLANKTPFFLERWRRRNPAKFQGGANLSEDPGIGHGSAPDHYAGDSAFCPPPEDIDTARHFADVIHASAQSPRKQQRLIDEMLTLMASDLIPERPDRSEPRAKKRRPKNYQLLTKPRSQMGNLPHRNRPNRKIS